MVLVHFERDEAVAQTLRAFGELFVELQRVQREHTERRRDAQREQLVAQVVQRVDFLNIEQSHVN